MRVRDLMTKFVTTVHPQMSVHDAARLLAQRHVAFAPVVAHWSVVGAIEATDLPATDMSGDGADFATPDDTNETAALSVGDVMRPTEVPRLSPDDDLAVAATRLALAGSRRGVVFQHSRLVGVLSTTDIVRALDGEIFGGES